MKVPAGFRPVYVGETILPTDLVWVGTYWHPAPGGQKMTPGIEEKFTVVRKETPPAPPTSDIFRE